MTSIEFAALVHELAIREYTAKAEKAEHEAEQARLSLEFTRRFCAQQALPEIKFKKGNDS